MYLSRLRINRGRLATQWLANPYRVHQRLMMGCEGDPRLLFRIEEVEAGTQILVQSHVRPNWEAGFADLPVLQGPPEHRPFEPRLAAGRLYRFRLRANPTVKRDGKRLGLLKQEDQVGWLSRKLGDCGAEMVSCVAAPVGMQHSWRSASKEPTPPHKHYAVLFEGVLRVTDANALCAALSAGVGAAKGFGFGLLSLARLQE